MSARTEPRTFWQWLRGETPLRVRMSWWGDQSPRYTGPTDEGCAWCEFCPHTTEAHRIQMLKTRLRHEAAGGDEFAFRKLRALEKAEREYAS